MHHHGDRHWYAALRVLAYAVSTAPLGIYYWAPRASRGLPSYDVVLASCFQGARARRSRLSAPGSLGAELSLSMVSW